MTMYTTTKTANELGVTTQTIGRWRDAGRFVPDSRTPGGHWRYSAEQVEKAKKGDFGVGGLLS